VSLAAAALAFAGPAMGQGSLGEVEAAYAVVSSEHAAAVAAFDRAFTLWEQASDRVGMARARQDGDELEDALAEFRERAIELTERERELSQAAGRLNDARAAYRTALGDREEQILALLDTPRGPIVEQALMRELVEVRGRADAIERAAGAPETITLRPVPELAVDPRDSLDDLFAKENLMQDVAESYDGIIVELQGQVAGLERQLQRAQSFEELRRSVERFGGDFVPGATLPPPPPAGADATDGPAGGDSAVTAESVEERIEHLRETIALAERYRDQAQVRAGLFRQQAEAMQR
jgi:hypothetical protein